jgi:hypothetical protein
MFDEVTETHIRAKPYLIDFLKAITSTNPSLAYLPPSAWASFEVILQQMATKHSLLSSDSHSYQQFKTHSMFISEFLEGASRSAPLSKEFCQNFYILAMQILAHCRAFHLYNCTGEIRDPLNDVLLGARFDPLIKPAHQFFSTGKITVTITIFSLIHLLY